MDKFKWAVVFIIAAGVIGVNVFYSEEYILYRALGAVFACVIGLGIAVTTKKGGSIYKLFKDARIELKKVVWPTRPEIVQTTIVVIIAVFIVSAVLWGLDSIFSWVAALLIG